jgi:hypothetical protein
MRSVGLAALAVMTIGVVVFVFVELHAAKAPTETVATPAPTSLPAPTPSVTEPAVDRPAPTPTPTQTPTTSQSDDPMDRVVQGKTRREWRSYYAQQHKRILADLDRYQEVIEGSSDGQEHDWAQVKDAHQRVRELREQMKRDLEDLARIENAP